MKLKLMVIRENKVVLDTFEYQKQTENEKPVVLDVLLQYQERQNKDYAYRYGCRNGLCGVCTVEVNGKPKLACRCKASHGDAITPLSTLPVLSDLVVYRQAVSQQLTNKLPVPQMTDKDANADNTAYQKLNRCIECYACLNECPLHEKNAPSRRKADFEFGNPYSLLRIQRNLVDANTSENEKVESVELAVAMGLETCRDCKGCRCGVGINLKKDVIKPLLFRLPNGEPDESAEK
jgi:succinate dehydrogenase/fumarate reductase iron-sulfur protein